MGKNAGRDRSNAPKVEATPLWVLLVQEFYSTMRANNWTPQVVDGLTVRQVVYGWAMVDVWEKKAMAIAGMAARAGQAEVKDTDFKDWLKGLGQL